MINKNIPIFFSVDDNYVPFLMVTLESIEDNASKNNIYNFYILTNGLKAENVERLLKYNKNNFTLTFVDMTKKIKDISAVLHTRDYYTKAIYYRLFIPSMFPNLNKAIYIDCDVCVKADIAELYNYDLSNNLLGAIADEAVSLVPEFQSYTKNCLGIEGKNYFNSGVLVLNLAELRKINFETKFFNALMSYKLSVAPDQDYLNVICKDRVTYIPKVWNKMPFKDTNLSLEEIKLIHYNLSYKPWHYENIEYEEVFWKYAKQANLCDVMKNILTAFTPELKQKDIQSGKHLLQMADLQSKQQDTLLSLLENGEIDKNTFLRTNAKCSENVFSGLVKKVTKKLKKV